MRIHHLLALVLLTLAADCQKRPQPAAAAGPATTTTIALQPPSQIEASNERMVEAMLARIAGKERLPASQVFSNVRYLAAVPAGQFLSIMSGGYARALGVTCEHCHDTGDFASDAKRPK